MLSAGELLLLCLGAFHNDVEHCICNLVILDCLEQLFAVLLNDLHDNDLCILLDGDFCRDKRQIGHAIIFHGVDMLKLDLVAVLVDQGYKIIAVLLAHGSGTSLNS